jgi:hypothetical protein
MKYTLICLVIFFYADSLIGVQEILVLTQFNV